MRDVLDPNKSCDPTAQERASALVDLMFLKEKRTGEVKGRGCADGRPQQDYMTKRGKLCTNFVY